MFDSFGDWFLVFVLVSIIFAADKIPALKKEFMPKIMAMIKKIISKVQSKRK